MHKIFGISKFELNIVIVILFGLFLASGFNINGALKKSRDAQRKGDIRAIYDALWAYKRDFGFFPLSSEDGKILACLDKNETKLKFDENNSPIFYPCEYGVDSLKDVTDNNYAPYLETIPKDPNSNKNYFYIATHEKFQILASLEGEYEDEYDSWILARSINCGLEFCNFGRSDGETPLDISIDQFEIFLKYRGLYELSLLN